MTVRIQARRQRVAMLKAHELERRTRPRPTDGSGARHIREQLGGSHAKGGEYQHWFRLRER